MRRTLAGIALATVIVVAGLGIARSVRSPAIHHKTVTVYKQALYTYDKESAAIIMGYPAPVSSGAAASSKVRRAKAAKNWLDKSQASVENLGYPDPYWGASWSTDVRHFNVWSEDFSKNCALEAKFEVTPKGQVVNATIRRLTMRQFLAAPAENLAMPAYAPYGDTTLKRLIAGCQPAT